MLTIQVPQMMEDDDCMKIGDRLSFANVSVGRISDGILQLTYTKKSMAKVIGTQ